MVLTSSHNPVISVVKRWSVIVCRDATAEDQEEATTGRDTSHRPGLTSQSSPSPGNDGNSPILYVFEDGDGVHTQESGAPRSAIRLRPSFQKDPDWLDQDTWPEPNAVEVKDGFRMEYWKEYMSLHPW
jgi:hypothetical protein